MLGFQAGFEIEKTTAFPAAHWKRIEKLAGPAYC
jgi:hypothetical protein